MRATITVEMDNAAFAVPDTECGTAADGRELARILRRLAIRVDEYTILESSADFPLFDTYGNKVGTFTVTE